ncbi:nucleotide exchange factor SIL1 [Tupaia chinensis]|uniref:nucleotide exchange factor SIL1 n=1 Tax=Tupaia chinensis TaxID=246437 RepID=UPI000FFC50AB|nr:nucleotide exchange factor SIL1 [Tupaia chinensis]
MEMEGFWLPSPGRFPQAMMKGHCDGLSASLLEGPVSAALRTYERWGSSGCSLQLRRCRASELPFESREPVKGYLAGVPSHVRCLSCGPHTVAGSVLSAKNTGQQNHGGALTERRTSVLMLSCASSPSNPKVQVEAIEGGALQKLLVILATEQPLTAKKKVLFALCSLLRHFPYAQQQFLKLGGLQVLRSLVQEKGTQVLAVRVVTLLYDLVTEKMFAEQEAELTQDTTPEKLQQYRQVHLLPGLREQGWCEITAHLLSLPEHDAREKVLQTLGALLATCRDHYRQDPQLSKVLTNLQAEYQALATLELQAGEDEGYFRELLGSINSLLKELR